MMIDRLGGLNPLNSVQNAYKTQKAGYKAPADSVAVSEEARELAEVHKAMEAAAAVPDVRLDRIAEVQAKMKDPNYISNAVIDVVADRIMDVFDI